ncbi:hypothetical protein ILUMI_00686 [Ignelater luminosus]|uniref:TIL domain-containing protein n=1 Tax=Ignelater luminosus TaxID=2038154 RepID=A0A8K0GPZ3_IGNLU|nr:hypothetical protein ILUMI_00686 [Ignelater luminosus]
MDFDPSRLGLPHSFLIPAYSPPPIKCTKPNERYECGRPCQTECATLGEPCLVANIRCNDACYCIPGYARDSTAYPLPPITCTGPGEVYACGSACDNKCATLGERCRFINVRCKHACFCISGYARSSTGICIPEDQCPPKKSD